MKDGYPPIEDYGVIGNMRTVALVSRAGSIDWFCYPHFDSPSVFAAILDSAKGGHFRIVPEVRDLARKQLYWPDTNILITRFLSSEGAAEIIDYMPVVAHNGHGYDGIIRVVKVIRGEIKFHAECKPAFNYARDPHEIAFETGGVNFHSAKLHLRLASRVGWKRRGEALSAEFVLKAGESETFELYGPAQGQQPGIEAPQSEALFRATIHFWRRWLHQSSYHGRWREIVHRSALVLKLLTFEPSGAIVAAPTTSLPEVLGGGRNWDYRYTWIRDSSFTIYSLLRLGFTEEAAQFMAFLDARCHELEHEGTLQVIYGIDGRHELTEETLDHLEGYKGSRPVRVGNAAYGQLQLDIYGELMDSVYLFDKDVTPISYDLWTNLRRLMDWLAKNWRRKDDAIWEVRGGEREFVFSKMMCWVAFDRALRLLNRRAFPADGPAWASARDDIYRMVMERGWNQRRQSFVQSFESDSLDASGLLMPLVHFISPTDPRMLSTVQAMMKPPDQGGLVSDGLVFRYDLKESPDGLKGSEGTFDVCTFWLVEVLTRAGKLDEARFLFERMLAYANHLGLYAEQVGFEGQALGNFPLAFTHLGLISAAVNLDSSLDAG